MKREAPVLPTPVFGWCLQVAIRLFNMLCRCTIVQCAGEVSGTCLGVVGAVLLTRANTVDAEVRTDLHTFVFIALHLPQAIANSTIAWGQYNKENVIVW